MAFQKVYNESGSRSWQLSWFLYKDLFGSGPWSRCASSYWTFGFFQWEA